MNKIVLSIIVMSSLLFYAGCGKQEEKKQSKVAVKTKKIAALNDIKRQEIIPVSNKEKNINCQTNISSDNISDSLTKFENQLSSLINYEKTGMGIIKDLSKLSYSEISNILISVQNDKNRSIELIINADNILPSLNDEGSINTGEYTQIAEYVLNQLWDNSPFTRVRYQAASILANHYVNCLSLDGYKSKYHTFDEQLRLGDTLKEDIERQIPLKYIGDLEDLRITAACLENDCDKFELLRSKSMNKWSEASEGQRFNRNMNAFNSLIHVNVSKEFRDLYLKEVINSISPSEAKRREYYWLIDYWKEKIK